MSLFLLSVAALSAAVAVAQDPAEGWLSYATASCPAGQRLTKFSGNWKVPLSPQPSDAFYSPWIGMDPADNLNLLQPVNPWLGDSWNIYCEYYQWSPENNIDSNQVSANSGDTLFGSMVFNGEGAQSYTLNQLDQQTGVSSGMTIPVQKDGNGNFKNYSIAYVVFEKTAYCSDYPPEQQITFYNLTMECNGRPYVPKWTTSFVEDCCNFRATVVNPSTIQMSWSTSNTDLTVPKEKIEAQYAKNRVLRAAAKKSGQKGAFRAEKAESVLPPQKKN